jgi:hypothetical protein
VSAIQEPAENNFKGSGFRSTQLNIRIAKNGMAANGVRTRFPTRSECRHISDQTSSQETPPQSQSKNVRRASRPNGFAMSARDALADEGRRYVTNTKQSQQVGRFSPEAVIGLPKTRLRRQALQRDVGY